MSSVPLSVDFVDQTIDSVIASEGEISSDESPDNGNVILRRTETSDDWNSLLSSLCLSDPSIESESDEESGDMEFSADLRTPFYFGIQALSSEPNQPGEKLVGFCTFYIAYSTWDGRMLYVDRINTESEGSLLLYRVMAKIAIETGCGRFTWKQKDRPNWSNTTVNPEYLDDWVFLSMDRLAMTNFVGSPSKAAIPNPTTQDEKETKMKPMLFLYVEDIIRETLLEQTSATVNLRLAGPDDTDTIARLVEMLAIYEKEPDAVNVTAQDYFRDGYDSTEPLFHCILADVVSTDDGVDDKTASTKTVAMGLFYFGHDMKEGSFIYLEDLFCEDAFRKKGIGSAIMKQLARISLALDCSRFVWTALDWNTPALTFYNKIGATLRNDLKITRYCGSDLKSFARSESK